MFLNKKKFFNLVFIALLAVLLFTPVGFKVKVLVNRLLSLNPSEIEKNEQLAISSSNWLLTSQNGAKINFKTFKGNVVVINFWATWCPPCIAEMPDFNRLYTDYGDRVTFLFIANDKKEKVTSYLTDEGYDLPVYYKTSKEPQELYSKSIPATFIIGKNGGVVVSETGSKNWDGEKARLLLDRLLEE
ncbi:TlpA family protein disulfide reductase [Cellulophaga baltica]|uniref:TlpA family protein disulfide reductase n=1 Tax=Cellulophaga TaxID=104264 RepID=UPI001C067054|nr:MULTISPECIES: TlpA disulfide reductase family protein [Cellulophaga]MBU2998027.1 TlpA family protein disulfide reductase [Cellulophaga baltica]MDO6769428.1 TlpA disulfide reductase family protein [Cellulophaga sp. 1_MG-2023]